MHATTEDTFSVEIVSTSQMLALMVEALKSCSVLFLDSETSGLDPYTERMLLIQVLGSGRDTAYVLVFNALSEDDKSLFTELLYDRELVFHNASFDLRFFAVHLGLDIDSPRVKIFDTQLAEAVLGAGKHPNLRQYTSLKNTLKRRFGITMDKDVRKEFIGHSGDNFTPEQIRYSALDIRDLPPTRREQIREAKEFELTDTLRLEFDLVKHVTRMHLNGVAINTDLWKELLEHHKAKKEEVYENLKGLVIPYMSQLTFFDEIPLNLSSSTQMLDFLTTNVGLKLEDTSEQSLSFANHPLCDALLEYREHEKVLSAFGEKTLARISSVTGRMHPEFNQCFTATGRFSSDSPNVQQIPSRGAAARIRECFVATPGYKMLCADYSQIELRILAQFSVEQALIDAYNAGVDIHLQTASVAFGMPVSEITSEQRKIAKSVSFGTVYGGGPNAIAKSLVQVLSEEEAALILAEVFDRHTTRNPYLELASEVVNSYFRGMPKAKEYLEESGRNAIYNRYSVTPLGRKRFYVTDDTKTQEEFKSDINSIRRRGMNHPIQGCSADITKLAILKLGEEFKKRPDMDGRILLQIHDEIVSEAKEEYAEEAAALQEEAMVWAGKQFIDKVPVEVDTHITDYWNKE